MADYSVTLLPSGDVFRVKTDEIILDAAIRQGVDVAYSCRNGTCRTCLFQALEGDIVRHDLDLCMLSEQEAEAGRLLLCMSTLKSDAVLEKPERRRKQ